ncbi:Alpha/Beta hydrolase protein [Rhizoctonia solani]|nr:Alpha/Beta hydrolase protein [Rhizoctonia solani]
MLLVTPPNEVPLALATAHPAGSAPKNPIVLCHGLLGFDTLYGIVNYWNEIPETLRAAGADVYVAIVSPTSSVEARAEELMEQINKEYPGRSVHLIGHSMGGLDCRYLVKHLLHKANFSVLSVSTIATPHRGSPAADVVVGTHTALSVTEIPGFSAFLNMFQVGRGDCQAWASLSTSNTKTFNACTSDVPGVRYLSYGCQFVPGIIDTVTWGASFHLLNLKEGENDGVVSVASAKWGEYLGTISGVNHTEVIGHKFTQTRPSDVLNFIGGVQPFDHKAFFLKHAKYLASNVEVY